MAPVVAWPTFLGLIVVGLFLAVIVVAVALSVSRAGKTAVAVCLVAPLFLFGSVCFFYLLAERAPSNESAIVEELAKTLDAPPRPLIPLEAPPSPIASEPAPPASTAAPVVVENSSPVRSEIANEVIPLARPTATASDVTTGPATTLIHEHRAGAARPAWMDQPTGLWIDGAYRTITTAGPYSTPQECRQKLNEAIREAVRNYIEQFMPERAGIEVELPNSFVHEEIARGEWLQQSEYAVGPMYNLHELLVFDGGVNKEIDRRYREKQIAGRLASTGSGAALVLGLIGTMFGYLKLDTLTRGYYTGRLRAAAATAILALATIAGLLVHGNIGF